MLAKLSANLACLNCIFVSYSALFDLKSEDLQSNTLSILEKQSCFQVEYNEHRSKQGVGVRHRLNRHQISFSTKFFLSPFFPDFHSKLLFLLLKIVITFFLTFFLHLMLVFHLFYQLFLINYNQIIFLLFNNQMSVKNTRQSLRSSFDYRSSCKYCENHQDRPATHQLVLSQPTVNSSGLDSENADQYFCEKCSIMLASQGFNVIKLANLNLQQTYKSANSTKRLSYQPITRKVQIQNFMRKVSDQLNQLINTDQFVYDYLVQAEDYYGNILKEVGQYFKQLEQLLELNKYKVYNSLLSNRSKEEEELREYRSILDEMKKELMSMIDDIEGNIDTVETTSSDMYSAIMSGYREKLSEITEICDSPPELKQLTFSIKTPEISTKLQKLSQKFIIYYPEIGTMPSSNASYNFKPIEYRAPQTQNNTKILSNNNSIMQNNAYPDNTISIQRSDSESSAHPEDRSLKQNNKNILNTENELKRSFEGSLGFSFEESEDNLISNKNEYMLRTYQKGDQSSEIEMDSSDFAVPNQASRIEQLSKISGLMHSKQVMESRESLGKYLNLSNSREASIEDADTLLIV